jgi:hypothetical protein
MVCLDQPVTELVSTRIQASRIDLLLCKLPKREHRPDRVAVAKERAGLACVGVELGEDGIGGGCGGGVFWIRVPRL